MNEPYDDLQDIPPGFDDYVAPPEAPHGTRNGYQNHMCRCPRCREAQNIYMKDYRAARAARRFRPSQRRAAA